MQVRGVYQRFPPPPLRVPYETRGLEVTKPASGVILGRVLLFLLIYWMSLASGCVSCDLCSGTRVFRLFLGCTNGPSGFACGLFVFLGLFTFARRGLGGGW